jgi:hypothetical protein
MRLYPKISKKRGGSSPDQALTRCPAPDLFDVITFFLARGTATH